MRDTFGYQRPDETSPDGRRPERERGGRETAERGGRETGERGGH